MRLVHTHFTSDLSMKRRGRLTFGSRRHFQMCEIDGTSLLVLLHFYSIVNILLQCYSYRQRLFGSTLIEENVWTRAIIGRVQDARHTIVIECVPRFLGIMITLSTGECNLRKCLLAIGCYSRGVMSIVQCPVMQHDSLQIVHCASIQN